MVLAVSGAARREKLALVRIWLRSRRTIARSAPVVFCEVLPVFDERTDMGRFRVRRQTEMLRLVGEIDYSIFRIYVNEEVEEVADFGGVHSDMTLANYIFVPNERLAAFRRDFHPAAAAGVKVSA